MIALPLDHDARIILDANKLRGGLHAWRAANLPIEELTQEQPIPGDRHAGIHRL